MGLSDGERTGKIFYSVNQLNKLSNQINHKQVKKLISKLWYATLGCRSNGIFWFLGGELDSDKMSENGLVSNAFKHIFHKEPYREKNEGFFEDISYVKEMVKMPAYLRETQKSNLLKAFRHCENIEYALSRYNDKYKKSLKSLNFVLRQLQGCFYDIFSSDSDYMRAWMLENIFHHKIFTYKEDDLVNQWAVKQHLHHNLNSNDLPFNEVKTLFVKYQFVKELDTSTKIGIILIVMGRKYHYKHEHKEFLKMVEFHNGVSEDKVDIDWLNELLEACSEKKKEHEEESHEQYTQNEFCFLTNNYHGNDEHTVLEKDEFIKMVKRENPEITEIDIENLDIED